MKRTLCSFLLAVVFAAAPAHALEPAQQAELNRQLREAATVDDVDTVRRLLGEGADVNGANEYGKTALMRAVESGVKMNPFNSTGPGLNLDRGEALYKEHCVKCHGENGEGKNTEFQPRIQGQHYEYLLRQFHWIKSGKRRNADETMVKQIKGFTERDITAVVDYTSRLRPPKEMVASPDWRNPDYPPDFTHIPATPFQSSEP